MRSGRQEHYKMVQQLKCTQYNDIKIRDRIRITKITYLKFQKKKNPQYWYFVSKLSVQFAIGFLLRKE